MGHPSQISSIQLEGVKREKQIARERLGIEYDPRDRGEASRLFESLSMVSIGQLDRKVKYQENLSFEEAFLGTCTVLAATNRRFYEIYLPRFTEVYGSFSHDKALALASAFLNLMATKESLRFLSSEEIAGMAAAGNLDTIIEIKAAQVVETCGMGGDRGFMSNGKRLKSINVSTLSSFVLAGLGLPVTKHGSYGNTSALGSTDAIERLGGRTTFTSPEEIHDIMDRAGFCFFDAHLSKTIHDLSHLLMMETVNHVIGPMTAPLHPSTALYKVMGLNEKVHPYTIAQAYAILHERGFRNVGVAMAVTGLSIEKARCRPYQFDQVRKYAVLDELSPLASIVSIVRGAQYLGTHVICPEDFGVTIQPSNVFLENTAETLGEANIRAIRGEDEHLSNYLALNAALGLIAYSYVPSVEGIIRGHQLDTRFLREAFERCRLSIFDGHAYRALERYVKESGKDIVLS
jgi:anthranilate phosphoribosyltransferase